MMEFKKRKNNCIQRLSYKAKPSELTFEANELWNQMEICIKQVD